jgi:N-acetylneuraminate synthase
MIIDRKIEKYIIYKEDAIISALEKISANQMRVIFVVNETGTIEGIVTDGDFRRWIVAQESVNLQGPVSLVANKRFKYCSINQKSDEIITFFSDKIDHIPLVDEMMHLVAVACKRQPAISIGKHELGLKKPTFIVAEIGNNHNGSLTLAKEMIDKAIEAGADCVKFQMRNLNELYSNLGDANDVSQDLGSQYVLDLLSRFQLKEGDWKGLFDYCHEEDICVLCTPWDESSVHTLDDYGIQAYKIASADFTNHSLLGAVAEKGKPMICSTGMSTEGEIQAGIEYLNSRGAQYILLHCNSTYPAPFKDINLNYLKRLEELTGGIVGYSGHERGIHVAIAAVAMGARVVEKHFTLDRKMEGNDHKVSLLPDEFRAMVTGIREIEQSLGGQQQRTVSQGELINRESLGKSLICKEDIAKGDVITERMIEVKSPGKGMPPYLLKTIVGQKSPKQYVVGDFFYSEDFDHNQITPRDFKFDNPFGVPVRYHDIKDITGKCAMDLVEIHLSYKDLDADLSVFFDKKLNYQLVVHSPELFAGDHVLDLCSSDKKYRQKSIGELQRVIDITNKLKTYFSESGSTRIVVNVGGFSADVFVSSVKKAALYKTLENSLGQLNKTGVELIPQTMPPFPWHFGGQRYHNLFVRSGEIVDFCKRNGYRVCLDLSHSKLACNHSKESFTEFLEAVMPVTAHMHIADSRGLDGEGLQIGDGDMDFATIMREIASLGPDVSFIPEIWQGHKNGGQGFWVALDRLERYSR